MSNLTNHTAYPNTTSVNSTDLVLVMAGGVLKQITPPHLANSQLLNTSNTTFSNATDTVFGIHGGAIAAIPTTQLGVQQGATLYVDATNGSDDATTGGLRGYRSRPFLTPAAARTAASSGDTIHVLPGSYSISASLAKDGVNWHFYAGASVTYAHDTNTDGIWDDGGAAMSFKVSGRGSFVRSTTNDFLAFSLIECSNSSSVISIEADSLTSTAGSDGICSAVTGSAGTIDVTARTITQSGGNSYAVWWTNGTMRVRARRITSGYAAVVSACDNSPTGDGHVAAEEIYGLISGAGTNTTAAFWVRANIIKQTVAASVSAITTSASAGNRLYVECQKVFGSMQCNGGLLYVRTDKVSAITNGTSLSPALLYVTGGTARIKSDPHLDPATFTGNMMKVTGGILRLQGGDYTAVAGAQGFEHTGGTSRLMGTTINTLATNTAFNPAVVSGSGLILDRCTLIANTSTNSVISGGANTITAYATKVNVAKHSNVTVNVDALTVDANVV